MKLPYKNVKEEGDFSTKEVEKNGINLKRGDADSHASDVGHWLGMTA